jgi:hypothetical protein
VSNWLPRPNNEYQLVYDVCAQRATQTLGDVAVIASSPFHARELAARLPAARACLIAAPRWTSEVIPDDPLKRIRVFEELTDLTAKSCIIWAEPTVSQLSHIPQVIDRKLVLGGLLCVLVSGRLAGRLSEWRERRAPASDPSETSPGWAKTERAVFPAASYTIRQRLAFRGLNALVWDYAGQFAARFGRDDLADRCGVAMRASFLAPEWTRSFSTIGVIVAEKTGAQRA